MPKTRKIIIFSLIGVVCIVLVVIYGRLNPENSQLFPKCPFKLLTTFECPGCGSQRAIHYLFNLEIGNAIRANALLVFSIPYILLLLVADLLKSKGQFFKRLHHVLYSPKAIWAVFAIIIIWWIFRNFV
ncbi:MAG: DUF2752 domain-containing protein [Bacteroidales bacterium]|jgi:hypothetical protein|nr:DUF2752 domain-containing protein [Bacteroidales bacterium]